MNFHDLDRPPLDEAALRAALVRPGAIWTEVVVTAETGSTITDVRAAALAGAPEGTVHLAESQTAGRGRLGRTWEAPVGSGLMVSVLLRPRDVPVARWVWLPLLVGLAVEAAAREAGVDAGLKWPNDVLVDGRKLAGILLERVETPDGPAAVVGVGINVSTRADELPVPTATSLMLEGATETDRTIVLRSFLRALDKLYVAWQATGGDPEAGLRESYVSRCVTLGTRVRVELPDGSTLVGDAEGIDEHGRLVVDGQAVGAGDVTHVRPAP